MAVTLLVVFGSGSAIGLDLEPGGSPTPLQFEDHGFVNPFTGGVAWEDGKSESALSMEWDFIGVSNVLSKCSGPFNWTSVDEVVDEVAGRGHQAILRPVFFGPGYLPLENFVPGDLPTTDFIYNGTAYDNPQWDLAVTQNCVLDFIDAFAARYKNDQRVAYIQMGLAGLWGEHHLDGAVYTAANFPSIAFQKTMVTRYLQAFGSTTSDLLSSISLDSAQAHGFFGSGDTSLDNERIGFFDDSLLIEDHDAQNNWRQGQWPAHQLSEHKKHGWGGEAFWDPCNRFGFWAVSPHDCGNDETLGMQAERVGLNYMLGSPAYTDLTFSYAELLTASQMMGYKFTATAAARQDARHIAVTVENTGAAYCPYTVEVCTAQGCGGDLSTLEPGTSVMVSVPASAAESQTLFFSSPRLDPTSPLKIRWSNVGADGSAGTLTVAVDAPTLIFADGFESGTTAAWTTTTP